MSTTTQSSHNFTIGVVPYMNAVPLVHCLHQVAPQAQTVQYPPRHLAQLLLNNKLDLALVPIVDVLRNPELQIVSNIGIAANGPVQSVIIQSRVGLESIRTIQLDPESSTSNALAHIIMKHHFHKSVEFLSGMISGGRVGPTDQPSGDFGHEFQTAGPSAPPYPSETDAEVLIGDKALQRRGAGQWECDLSEAWHTLTGMPFVFAAWAARKDHSHLGELARITDESLRRGQPEIPFIARQQAIRLRLPSALCLNYLSKVIHYNLSEKDLLAVKAFQTYNADLITPSGALA